MLVEEAMLLGQLTVTHARILDQATGGRFFGALSSVVARGLEPVVFGERECHDGGSSWALVVGWERGQEVVMEVRLPIPNDDLAALASVVQLHLVDYVDELKRELAAGLKDGPLEGVLDDLLPFRRSKEQPS